MTQEDTQPLQAFMPTQTSTAATGTPLLSKVESSSLLNAPTSPPSPSAALPRPTGDIFSKQPIEIRLHILELMNPTNLDLLRVLQVSRTWRSTLANFNEKFWEEKCIKLDAATTRGSDQTWYSLWLELMRRSCLACSAPTTVPFGVLCPEVPRWTVVCARCRSSGYSYFHVKEVRNKRDLAFLPRAEVDALPSRPSEKWKDEGALEYWGTSIDRLRLKQAGRVRDLKVERKVRKHKILGRYPSSKWLGRGLFETKTSPLYTSHWEELQTRLLGTDSEAEESALVRELAEWAEKLVGIEIEVARDCSTRDHIRCKCLARLKKKPSNKNLGKTWLQALLAGKASVKEFMEQDRPLHNPSTALTNTTSSWNTASGVTSPSNSAPRGQLVARQTITIPTTFTLTCGQPSSTNSTPIATLGCVSQ